jgi:murein DD-endopeptidase MepM/ murein hydrolase activator NlpD
MGQLLSSILSTLLPPRTEHTTPFTMATIHYYRSKSSNVNPATPSFGKESYMSTKNPRTFVLGDKLMTGEDVKQWQDDVKKLFKDVGIKCPIVVDGIYAQATRSFSAALCEAYGLISKTAMAEGVTPELRTKLRHNDLNKAEKSRFESKARKNYRAKLRDRWHTFSDLVHPPVAKIITDAWGFHPGVHDGEDVIAIEGTAAFAMVKCKIIDVRAHGWWHLGAPSNKKLRERGDGIVQMEVLANNGPFKKGMHIGYGHCVHPVVRVGQIVQPGQVLAKVGFANAAHIHLMVNNGKVGLKGVGNLDPRPLVDYAVKHG